MASRTFGNYKRGSVTIEQYFDWQDKSPAPACRNSTNRAFISSMASDTEIQAAKDTCSSCPLLAGCEFFANTKHFKEFDGVMGGHLLTNAMDDEFYDESVMVEEDMEILV